MQAARTNARPLAVVLAATTATLCCLVVLAQGGVRLPAGGPSAPVAPPAVPTAPVAPPAVPAPPVRPLSFEPNRGQTSPEVDFLARGQGYTLFLASGEAVLSLASPERGRLHMRLVGAARHPAVEGAAPLPGRSSYIRAGRAGRATSLPTFARVRYRDVYPGVDLAYYGNQGQLEYDFTIAPGADAARIGIEFGGARTVGLREGAIVLDTAAGELRQPPPFAYQEVDGERRQVPARYVLDGHRRVRLHVGAHDARRPLVVDPQLVYSTYLGGSGTDLGGAVAVGGDGSAYVVGSTDSPDFPGTEGAFRSTDPNPANRDAFVTKLGPDGSTPVYSTYLGGAGQDEGRGIAVDAGGHAFVTGRAASSFPTTPGAFQADDPHGSPDFFVAKLSADGSSLDYSTYLGGDGFFEDSAVVAVDGAGHAYVTGRTDSTDFPTTAGALQPADPSEGAADAFVAELSPDASALEYSTYLGGGAGSSGGTSIAVESGSAYVAGSTTADDFPTTAGALLTAAPSPGATASDGFVAKLSATGSALDYSTFVGGAGDEPTANVAVRDGSAYLTGSTDSSDFPTTGGALQPGDPDPASSDGFVSKLRADGAALDYSTYLGGRSEDGGHAVAVADDGSAVVAGQTDSPDFPTTAGSLQADDPDPDGSDGYVARLGPDGSSLDYSTYLGGVGFELVRGLGLDSGGAAYVTGPTRSPDFPTTPGAFQASDPDPGNGDAFVSKLETETETETEPGSAALALEPATATNAAGEEHCVTATLEDGSGDPIDGATVRFSVSGASSASGSATTDSNGEAGFCYTGTTAGDDSIHAFADLDVDGSQGEGEPGATAAKTYVAAVPASLELDPATSVNPVGSEHCVTATVRDAFGNPNSGVGVRFWVAGSVVTGGTDATDEQGRAELCYEGPALPGVDAIMAYADGDGDGARDEEEPFGAAVKTWVLPDSTPSCRVRVGGWLTGRSGDRATFGGRADVSSAGAASGQLVYIDHGPAEPVVARSIKVLAVACSADRRRAAIYGTATAGGAEPQAFRIRVADAGEPGAADAYGIVLSAGYASGDRRLDGGNVQVR
ncbi:MAG TPA: SBBP repeat-containing protein [Thermoleophilaceae bacterium]